MTAPDDGFLSRWSRRKQLAKTGEPLPPEPAVEAPPQRIEPTGPIESEPPPVADAPLELPPPPTLDDVARLTPDSDYSRFVRSDVDDGVKRAAMKKLFADPHFNVMDGLDVYIDDYNKPDPLPASMLRQMAQAKFLGLFDDEDKKEENKSTAPPEASTDGAATPDAPPLRAAAHENPDLQLQPDDAARREGAGDGADDEPGRVG